MLLDGLNMELFTLNRVVAGVVTYSLLAWIISYITSPKIPKSIPWVGKGKGFISAIKEMPDWIQGGYDTHNKNGNAFVVPAILGNPPEVVIPRSQMAWMIDAPDDVLSTSAAHYDGLHGDHNFLERQILRDPYHEHVVHRSLARSLNDLIPAINDEVCFAADIAFGTSTEWRSLNVWNSLLEFIPRVTNRMLVGAPLCREKSFLDAAVAITNDIVRNMMTLTLTPAILKPFVGPIMSLPNKYHFAQTAKHTIPLIKRRMADMQDPDFKPPNDYVSWHISIARAEGRADELTPKRIAQRIIPLNFASIHTTTLTAHNALLDILASSDRETLALLREEAQRVYAEEGGRWTKAGLARLYRIDSAIRESMRVSGFARTIVQKKVVAREGVVNPETGWRFEYGTNLTCPVWATAHDPKLFGEKADEFDAFRYSRDREEYDAREQGRKNAGDALKVKQMGLVTTSDAHYPFGHGRHACPGRFFVAHELKMLFAYLFINYEVEPLEERPKTRWIAKSVVPAVGAQMRIRRRQGTAS